MEVFPTAASPVTTTLTVGTGLAACPGEDALGEAPVRGIRPPAPAAAILWRSAPEHERARLLLPGLAATDEVGRLGRGAVRGEAQKRRCCAVAAASSCVFHPAHSSAAATRYRLSRQPVPPAAPQIARPVADSGLRPLPLALLAACTVSLSDAAPCGGSGPDGGCGVSDGQAATPASRGSPVHGGRGASVRGLRPSL